MLYKRYHRSYVSQFKKGVKFNHPSLSPDKMSEREVVEGIEIATYYTYYGEIYVVGERTGRWYLVFSDGRINKKKVYICCTKNITEIL